jgi:pyridoxal phosphate enzyme (YggS family)
MSEISENLKKIKSHLSPEITLVAVSKTQPTGAIEEAYQTNHRDFGENKAREMQEKADQLPEDIRWHFIGHLQRNKVKYIAPHVHMIHSVDSLRLLKEIDKRAENEDRTIKVLLQVYIAKEESKYGLDEEEVIEILNSKDYHTLKNVQLVGLMGMATNTDKVKTIQNEFTGLRKFFERLKKEYFADQAHFKELSIGMSNDYEIALEEGSTMLRIGSAVFGERGGN